MPSFAGFLLAAPVAIFQVCFQVAFQIEICEEHPGAVWALESLNATMHLNVLI